MFWNKKKEELTPIDIRFDVVTGILGNKKLIHRSKRKQKKIKRELEKKYPNRKFVDDLYEKNSIKGNWDELSWIDDIENYNAFTEF